MTPWGGRVCYWRSTEFVGSLLKEEMVDEAMDRRRLCRRMRRQGELVAMLGVWRLRWGRVWGEAAVL